ncbi:MAG: hypothetical protein P8Y53_14915, partial [Pseudolabrys sp.]
EMQPGSRSVIPFGAAARTEKIALQTRFFSILLVFIDPTGWTGYPLDKIRPLFGRTKCELLINFMYDFINRFAASEDPDIVESLAPILGGVDWQERLDVALPRVSRHN